MYTTFGTYYSFYSVSHSLPNPAFLAGWRTAAPCRNNQAHYRHTLQTHSSSFLTQRTYSCSNFVAISSLVLELLKKCRVRQQVGHTVDDCFPSRTTDSHLKRISTNFCIHTVVPPDDWPTYARNMQRLTKYTKNRLCIKLVFLYTMENLIITHGSVVAAGL